MPVKRRKTNPTSTPTAAVTVDSVEGAFSEAAHELALALIETCLAGDLEGAAVLVGQGADAWVQDTEGWSALHAAASSGNDTLVTFLLRKCNAVWNLVDNLGYTAGDIAYSLNDSTTYAILLAEGLRSELLRAVMEQLMTPSEEEEEGGELSTAGDNKTFLASKLRFMVDGNGQEICVDRENNGVMMGWERGLMEASARKLCEAFEGRRAGREMEEELNVVNVGFGLGIIDGYLQEYKPTYHLIIEPHPDVLASARAKGWYEKPGVHIFEGTWQAYLAALEAGTEEYMSFDAVYFDTYSEHYHDLHAFFDSLPNLLRSPSSRFSFFHGLGATSRFFYDVYTEVSELHLKEMGLTTKWSEVEVGTVAGVGRFLKGMKEEVQIVLSDPQGSGLFHKVHDGVMYSETEEEGKRRRHQMDTVVEGIGLNRLTRNFSHALPFIDDAIRVTDAEAVAMSRHLAQTDGLFLGSSSAVNLVACVRLAKKWGPQKGKMIVTILCDSGTRHYSRFWNDDYLREQGIPISSSIESILAEEVED